MDSLLQMKTALLEGEIDTASHDEQTIMLSHKKNVSVRILFAMAISIGFLWLGYNYPPLGTPNLLTFTDRLVYTVRWQIPSALILLAAILATGIFHGNSEQVKPLAKENPRLAAHKNFLTNTFEQFVINLMAQLILTTYLSTEQMQIIPLLVTLFVIGRLQYWSGYLDTNRGRSNKAFGFGMTFYVTVCVLVYCAYRFIVDLL